MRSRAVMQRLMKSNLVTLGQLYILCRLWDPVLHFAMENETVGYYGNVFPRMRGKVTDIQKDAEKNILSN